jgi:hypothetical protein
MGLVLWPMAAAAGTQSTTAIEEAKATVDTTRVGVPALALDALYPRFVLALTGTGWVSDLEEFTPDAPVTSIDANGVRTIVHTHYLYARPKLARPFPTLLISITETHTICPGQLPTGTSCTTAVELILTGPLAAYGALSPLVDVEKLLKHRQTFTWMLTPTTGATAVSAALAVDSLEFEGAIHRLVTTYGERTGVLPTQRQILQTAARGLRDMNEHILQERTTP